MYKLDIESTEKFVRFILDKRIPFEPKGELINYREQIRLELLNLVAESDEKLLIRFLTDSTDFFDVENIVLYNIGTAYFRDITHNGLIIEFPITSDLGNDCFKYEYKLIVEPYQSVFDVFYLLDFDFSMDKISGNLKPIDYWMGFHHGMISKVTDHIDVEFIGLDIEITCPTPIYNVATCIKPMLDGIISALHCYSDCDDSLIEYISDLSKVGVDSIRNLFMPSEYNLLGERKLISRFGKGYKWNPKDEVCRLINISVKVDCDRTDYQICGKVNLLG